MPTWPDGVVHLSQDTDVAGYTASFGLWLWWPANPPLDPDEALAVIGNWASIVVPYFLACMNSSASFTTCRLTHRGTTPFRFVSELAPNHGAGSSGATLAISAGVYIQSSSGARGSGTRIHIPAINSAMYNDPGVLSTTGVNNLLALTNAIATWPQQLFSAGAGTVQLGTLQQRRGGQLLSHPTFVEAIGVRPTYKVETISRRLHQIRAVSPS